MLHLSNAPLKEYTGILTTYFYGMNHQNKQSETKIMLLQVNISIKKVQVNYLKKSYQQLLI